MSQDNKVITGVDAVVAAMGKALREDPPKIAAGLLICGGVIKRKADYYCPTDTRAMIETGRIEVTGTGLNATVNVAYGGPTAPYTLFVHEDLTAAHASPTCAKWLERAVRETRGTCASVMKRTLSGQMGLKRGGSYVE